MASTCFSNALKQMKAKYSDEFDTIVELLKKIAKAEAAAERARKQVLDNEKEQAAAQKKKILNVDKLRDARKLGKDSILLLCEGLSAGGSMSIGRDANKYGILMLRGKCKNLLNCTIEEGLQNEEVKLFQQALGVIYGHKTSESQLRYGKIAIASDSDFDGSHIGLLILAMAHIICPNFLTENRIYWLRAPIYKVETKNKNYYYYSEEEFAKHPNGNIIKYKGLGQMSDNDLKESMFSDEWQRLEPITFSEEGLSDLVELMGPKVDYRKEFVYNNIDFSKFVIE
jgi:DNA gyrase/topoisomerase IV subunit B